jgi:hypothetical protein
MKISMVIPTYWCEKEKTIYDHPTHLSEEGTLARTLKSLYGLEDHDFDLYIIGCSTEKHVEKKVEEKLVSLLKKTDCPVKTYLFTHSDLRKLHVILTKKGITSPLSLDGYSNIRNVCIALPLLFGSDTVVLIDDDELLHQQTYMSIVKRDLPGNYGLAGYYLKDGTYVTSIKRESHNNKKTILMNEALHDLIETKHMQPTYFALGGNLVLGKEIIQNVSFDPKVIRGEDMDYVMNAKMFGYPILFDADLTIEHQPPPHSSSEIEALRKSTERFIYESRKIQTQKKHPDTTLITHEDMGIYPGTLLDNPEPIFVSANTHLLTSLENTGKKKEAKEVQKTLESIPKLLQQKDVFETYYKFNKEWQKFMKKVDKISLKNELRTF